MFMTEIEKHLKFSLKESLFKYLPKGEGEREKLIENISALVIQNMVDQGYIVKGDRFGSIHVILPEPKSDISHTQKILVECRLLIKGCIYMK
jgi:hypothetical protein